MQGRLIEVDEFADVIVGSKPDGSFIRIRDIGRVELGARSYSNVSQLDGKPAAAISIALVPGRECARDRAPRQGGTRAARDRRSRRASTTGSSTTPRPSSRPRSRRSCKTFFEALLLVLIVVFLFLQNWRTTLIPMLAVPVSLVATFAAFQLLGFSINTLSLFGMVLAIGIVVDDAIVVVEAVEHNMRQGLAVRDATVKAMDEVQGPVVAIALILAAVFVPMGFIPGVTGQLYKQFAVTVAVSTMFSALVALTLTPALCMMLMKPHEESHGPLARFFKAFNSGFDRLNVRYGAAAAVLARRTLMVMLTMGALIVVIAGLFRSVPTGFVPDEDKGAVFMQVVLPDAASQERTVAVLEQVVGITRAVPGVESVVSVVGLRPASQAPPRRTARS